MSVEDGSMACVLAKKSVFYWIVLFLRLVFDLCNFVLSDLLHGLQYMVCGSARFECQPETEDQWRWLRVAVYWTGALSMLVLGMRKQTGAQLGLFQGY